MGGSTRTRRAIARTGLVAGLVVAAVATSPLAAGAAHLGSPAAPDYVITVVNEPPAKIAAGGTFAALDTTKNQGTGDAVETSQTLYYLSSDTALDAGDTVLGGRGILGLAVGETSSGGLNAHVPANMAPGLYFVITCADGSNNVFELDETNNCMRSSTQVEVALADYKVTALTEPPAAGQRGMAFTIFDTTKNVGPVDGPADAFTYYYFSKDRKLDGGDRNFGGRGMFALGAHKANTGGLNAHVPSDMAPGSYYVIACADAGSATTESNETNNCRHSLGKMTITVPDYVVSTVGTPPAQATRGSAFDFSDVVKNRAAAAPFTTTNAYYLSKDVAVDESDVQFAFAPEIAPLGKGETSSDNMALTVPSTAKLGFFHIIVCADATNVLGESNETNNCRASTAKVHIIAS